MLPRRRPRAAHGATTGIDRGWAYALGANVVDDVIQAVATEVAALPAPLGADLVAAWPPGVVSALSAQFSDFVDRVMAAKPRGELMVVGALQPSWIAALAQRSRAPVTAEIAVRDRDMLHIFRDAKVHTLPLDWYRDLPRHLGQPAAVLLDSSHADPALLLLYDVAGTEGRKLVLRLDYRLSKPKGQVVNLIQTGRVLDRMAVESLRGQVGRRYSLLEGSLRGGWDSNPHQNAGQAGVPPYPSGYTPAQATRILPPHDPHRPGSRFPARRPRRRDRARPGRDAADAGRGPGDGRTDAAALPGEPRPRWHALGAQQHGDGRLASGPVKPGKGPAGPRAGGAPV